MKKQHEVVSAVTLLNLSYIFLSFVVKGCFCLDPFYESCVPKDCGDGINITFPFYIQGLQDPTCAFPGFKLQCNHNGSSVIRISENDYLVKNIDYNTRLLRLVNTPDITCLSQIKNLTLDPNRFLVNNVTTRELVFLTNCSRPLSDNLTSYSIGSCNPAIDQLVMLKNDTSLGMGKESCKHAVTAPVELQTGQSKIVDGGNYKEVMKRGFTLSFFAPGCGQCSQSGGRCGFNMSSYQFRCFCKNRPHRVSCLIEGRRISSWVRVILLSALVGGAVTILIVIILCLKCRTRWRKMSNYNVNLETFLKDQEFLAPKRYSYSQVQKMTNSFEVTLGQGGFGSVYKGSLKNGSLVAVKVLSELKGNGEDFINEVASVGRTSHVNIVSLVGFCLEGYRRALIYEFMPNGSLEKFRYERNSSNSFQIGWQKLHEIAIGIARGLEYLHRGCNTRILHFDIKPHNILLDTDFCPKISDFGLAKLFPQKRSMISMSHMRGTPGYIAPEVFSKSFGQVSHKSDVYSYGMMILEMVGGRRNTEVENGHTSEIYFPHWIYKKFELDEEQLGLHGIVDNEENELARKMIIVGLWCIQTNPLNRPTITKVLEMLEGDLASLEIPPKPYLSSPSRSVDETTKDYSQPYSSYEDTL